MIKGWTVGDFKDDGVCIVPMVKTNTEGGSAFANWLCQAAIWGGMSYWGMQPVLRQLDLREERKNEVRRRRFETDLEAAELRYSSWSAYLVGHHISWRGCHQLGGVGWSWGEMESKYRQMSAAALTPPARQRHCTGELMALFHEHNEKKTSQCGIDK